MPRSASTAPRCGTELSPRQIERLRHEAITWQLAQFLHGEQGALLATAQIVDTVPWYEAKQYGATQVMDEARHVEVYRRFLQEKLEHEYPVNAELKKLLDLILTDSRWDMKFLGMQIMVEGLALAAFRRYVTRRTTRCFAISRPPWPKTRRATSPSASLSLREFCRDLSEKDRAEREDFVYEASVLMRDRILNRDVWERMGLDADACVRAALESPLAVEFRRRLFSKIVPNVKSLGLLSDRQRRRFAELGILEFERGTTSDVDQAIADEQAKNGFDAESAVSI